MQTSTTNCRTHGRAMRLLALMGVAFCAYGGEPIVQSPPGQVARLTRDYSAAGSKTMRVTLSNETHEAIFSRRLLWDLTVPSEACFETWVGVSERSSRQSTESAIRFKILVGSGESQPVTLIEDSVKPAESGGDPRWKAVRADLSAYAGRPVQLSLDMDYPATLDGDYACWGNPLVFSRQKDVTSTPVILISCDALRADHLSCYGYSRETSPHLDAWVKETAFFENAVAQETWTLPSHRSMLTGLRPKNVRLAFDENSREVLAEDVVTLSDALAQRDYLTAGYTGHSWWLLPWRGFAQGADLYNTPKSFRHVFDSKQLAEAWIQECRTPRFFLFFHNYDIHSKLGDPPYTGIYDNGDPRFRTFSKAFVPPPSCKRPGMEQFAFTEFLQAHNDGKLVVTPEERDYLMACYDDCIRYVDQAISEFFSFLKKCEIYDRALIIVTADHGEAFGEHGCFLHKQVYEECCHVPLLIKFPYGKFAGRRMREVVELTDLFPTVLDVVGLPPEPSAEGQSLVPVLEGESKARNIAFTQRNVWQAVRAGDKKLVRNMETSAYECYDLGSDPKETRNLIENPPPELAELKRQLEGYFEVQPDGWHLLFRSPEEPWNATLTISSESPFHALSFDRRIDSESAGAEGHRVTAAIAIIPGANRRSQQEWVIKPTMATSPMKIMVTSESVFTAGGSTATTFQTTLLTSASTPDAHTQNASPAPSLTYWYRQPTVKSESGQGLSEEAIQDLKALGYLDSEPSPNRNPPVVDDSKKK